MTMLTVGDYTVKVTRHNYKNCFIGEFVDTSKFPIIYGDTIREVEETAEEYVMEEHQNELCDN